MKKYSFVYLAVLLLSLSMILPSSILASGPCDNLTVVTIGTTTSPSIPSGIQIYLKNETNVACIDFPVGAMRLVNLSDQQTEKTLAVLLTAASLKKKVWAYTVGTAAPYTLGSVQVKNIAQ